MMPSKRLYSAYVLLLSLCWAMPAWAVDSYRYLHVSIDTPWSIFVFLFFLVFAPMILAVVLHWRHALKKDRADETPASEINTAATNTVETNKAEKHHDAQS